MKQDEKREIKLESIDYKAVDVSQERLVRIGYFQANQTLPLVVWSTDNALDLVNWAESNRTFIETELLKHGALLFRGFASVSLEVFRQFALAIATELVNYIEGSSPRVTHDLRNEIRACELLLSGHARKE